MASFAPKAGCPMCSIVATASHTTPNSPRAPQFPPGSTQAEVLWRDDNLTAYREKANPVSSKGHVIIVFNLHVPSIYTLASSDVPLLSNVRNLATRLLATLTPSIADPPVVPQNINSQFRIGFITPPFKDSKIPVTDHLHAHAFIGPPDLLGWWRGVAYGPLAWYPIEDLIAEIRESVSNNRVKSGYENRGRAPIDMVPSAGARAGHADGVEISGTGIANFDSQLEDGEALKTLEHTSPQSLNRQTLPQTPS